MRSVIRFLNAKNTKPAEIHCQLCWRVLENMPRVVQWYGDGCDSLMKDAKMCMMIRGAADRLCWTKIWCVQLMRRLERTDDSPFRHFSLLLPQISPSLLNEIVSDKLKFRKLCARWVPKPLPRALHRRRHRSTMNGYKNCCPAMTSASTMVETMPKSSVRYVHQRTI